MDYTNYTHGALYTLMCNYTQSGYAVAYIRGLRCKSELDFFYEISAALRFPFYFGENWNAVDDCLTDLEWLSYSGILFVIDDFDSIFEGDKELQAYMLRHIQSAVSTWNSENIPNRIILNRTKTG